MSQTETAKAIAAGERTEETRSFVRTVKAAAPSNGSSWTWPISN